MIRAAILAGIVGNIAISIYLSIALPVFFHTAPIVLFQWDDSNIVGDIAFSGGLASAGLGFFFDFIVSIVWGGIYVVLYRMVPLVRRSVSVSGLVFGALVMLVMFTVVVPLGHAHQSTKLPGLLDSLVAHTVFFGLPVAFTVRQCLLKSTGNAQEARA
jgi:uncharacterized membrane protein YagU involved in acid resistance